MDVPFPLGPEVTILNRTLKGAWWPLFVALNCCWRSMIIVPLCYLFSELISAATLVVFPNNYSLIVPDLENLGERRISSKATKVWMRIMPESLEGLC